MQKLMLMFPNASEVNYLQFSSELTTLQEGNGWEVIPNVEQRGRMVASLKILRVFGNKQTRAILLGNIIVAMLHVGLDHVLIANEPTEGPGKDVINVHIENSTIIIIPKPNSPIRITIDSANVKSQIDKLDSLFID